MQPAQDSAPLSLHRVALARELVDDVELGRLPQETLLLKASRLARLVEDADVQKWLDLELRGYTLTDINNPYSVLTGRLTDPKTLIGFWQPLAGLMAYVRAMEAELQSLRVPDVSYAPSNPNEWFSGLSLTAPVNTVLERAKVLTSSISNTRGIVSKVMALLHDFVAKTYYKLAYGGLAEGIFDTHRKSIDALLARVAPDALAKIPAVMDRLAAGDSEPVSQALTTGRRILSSFADAVQPPVEGKLEVDGQLVDAGPPYYLNRLRAYVAQNCESSARRTRLRQTLSNLNDRFNAGTHADVTAEEARALFVVLYVTLGELLALGSSPGAVAEE